MGPKTKHGDHDHIHARLQRYVQAYEKEDIKALMEFMDEKDFVYTQFGQSGTAITLFGGAADFWLGTGRNRLTRADIESEFNNNFDNFYNLSIKTISFHGHKNFTAWEWVMKYRHALDEQGKRRPKDKSETEKIRGCSLMWWNDNDKIVKQHDYLQRLDPHEAETEAETEIFARAAQ